MLTLYSKKSIIDLASNQSPVRSASSGIMQPDSLYDNGITRCLQELMPSLARAVQAYTSIFAHGAKGSVVTPGSRTQRILREVAHNAAVFEESPRARAKNKGHAQAREDAAVAAEGQRQV